MDDIEELKEFLQRQRFDRVGTFTYSHEEGTSGFALADDVPAEEKKEEHRKSWKCSRRYLLS